MRRQKTYEQLGAYTTRVGFLPPSDAVLRLKTPHRGSVMTTARSELLGIVHAVACRAIRHDTKVPLDHIHNFCESIAEILSKDAGPSRRIATEVLESVSSIPKRATYVDDKISELEDTLKHRADYSGEYAKKILQDLIHDHCTPLENDAKRLRDAFENETPALANRARQVAVNATAAKARLASLVAFFRDDFRPGSLAQVSLDAEAHRVASAVAASNRKLDQVFDFSGRGTALGSRTLLQAIFQNVYQNALKYGGTVRDLRISTRIEEGPYATLVANLDHSLERPTSESTWTRIDISNNGPPIPVSNVNYIFRLGIKYAVDGVSHEDSQGLGMSICFAAASLHRGTIFADSKTDGVRLHILLPKDPRQGFNDAQLHAIATDMDIV